MVQYAHDSFACVMSGYDESTVSVRPIVHCCHVDDNVPYLVANADNGPFASRHISVDNYLAGKVTSGIN